MLNSFCKQNNDSGGGVCRGSDSLAGVGYPRCMLINRFWAKVLVVQGLRLMTYIWTVMLILNFLKTLLKDCCTLRATMVDQPFWGYFTSPL